MGIFDGIRRWFEDAIDQISPELGQINRRANEKIENLGQTIGNALTSSPLINNHIRSGKDYSELSVADHLYVQRSVYQHHGLYIGNGEVAHYIKGTGIGITSLEVFADGDNIHVKNTSMYYSKEEVINRAISRLGEQDYFLLMNNCENFVSWCRNGRDK
jgi:hypothetical protein